MNQSGLWEQGSNSLISTCAGKTCSSTKMAYQWKKAKFMGEEGVVQQILKAGEPRRAKGIANAAFGGRQRRTWGNKN